MNEGKDIVGLSVPFTAGIACGALFFKYASTWLSGHYIIFTLASFLGFACFALLFLFLLRRNKCGICYLLFFFLGAFCFANGCITECGNDMAGGAAARAEASAAHMREIIESIPYSNAETSGVVKALTTGDRSGLGRATTRAFRRSGAAHLLALSGLHLGIIYMLLLWLAAPLGRSPAASRLRSLLVVGLSGYYSIATGRSPSIMRAFYFITINEASRLLHIRQRPIRVLCAALMLQLTLSPSVITSVGFQLSYLAMTGIILLFPKLKSWYPSEGKADRFNIPYRIWNVIAISVSCQVFTAPACWYYFKTFPKYFILTNLAAIPLTTAVMLTSIATIALTAAGLCPTFLVRLNEYTVSTLLRLLEIISSMP